MNFIDKLLLRLLVWAGGKLFGLVDVYAPKEDVEAVTFSNNEEYIEKISNIELGDQSNERD